MNKNKLQTFAQAIVVDKNELWKMFAKSGDIELYSMYRSLKDDEDNAVDGGKENANSRP